MYVSICTHTPHNSSVLPQSAVCFMKIEDFLIRKPKVFLSSTFTSTFFYRFVVLRLKTCPSFLFFGSAEIKTGERHEEKIAITTLHFFILLAILLRKPTNHQAIMRGMQDAYTSKLFVIKKTVFSSHKVFPYFFFI